MSLSMPGIWTVQELIDQRMRLHAYCDSCNHNEMLDLQALRDKIGPDAPAMAGDLIPKLRCAKCGDKRVSLVYAPDTTPTGKYGTEQAIREGR